MRNTYTDIWLDFVSEKNSKMENIKSNWIDFSTFSNFMVESNRKNCQLCNIPASYESKSKNRDIVITFAFGIVRSMVFFASNLRTVGFKGKIVYLCDEYSYGNITETMWEEFNKCSVLPINVGSVNRSSRRLLI